MRRRTLGTSTAAQSHAGVGRRSDVDAALVAPGALRCAQRLHVGVLVLAAAALAAPRAAAYDYNGYINIGAYEASERLTGASTEPNASVNTNDDALVLGMVHFDASRMGSSELEFVLDARDKYDSYGHLTDGSTQLVADNDPQLRQLAVKAPPATHTLFWSIGRFMAADAGVLGNDGAELGYRVSPRTRVSLFGGLYPEQRGGRSLKLSEEDHQVGTYAVYQNGGKDGNSNTYAASSIVLRRAVAGVASYDNPAAPLVGDVPTVGPKTLPSTQPIGNYLFWYTNIVHQPSNETRYTYLAQIDIEPQVHVRDLWASAYHQLSQKLAGTLSILRLDLTEYQRQRDLLDTLPISAYTEVRGDVRWRLSKTYLLDTDVMVGERSADQKSATGIGTKLVAASLMGGHLSTFVGGGYRRNFISHDLIGRVGGSYYTPKTELTILGDFITENRFSGEILHPVIISASLGYMLNNELLASFTAEVARDERATVLSAMLTLGYRFTNRQLTPIRDQAPRLERL